MYGRRAGWIWGNGYDGPKELPLKCLLVVWVRCYRSWGACGWIAVGIRRRGWQQIGIIGNDWQIEWTSHTQGTSRAVNVEDAGLGTDDVNQE